MLGVEAVKKRFKKFPQLVMGIFGYFHKNFFARNFLLNYRPSVPQGGIFLPYGGTRGNQNAHRNRGSETPRETRPTPRVPPPLGNLGFRGGGGVRGDGGVRWGGRRVPRGKPKPRVSPGSRAAVQTARLGAFATGLYSGRSAALWSGEPHIRAGSPSGVSSASLTLPLT